MSLKKLTERMREHLDEQIAREFKRTGNGVGDRQRAETLQRVLELALVVDQAERVVGSGGQATEVQMAELNLTTRKIMHRLNALGTDVAARREPQNGFALVTTLGRTLHGKVTWAGLWVRVEYVEVVVSERDLLMSDLTGLAVTRARARTLELHENAIQAIEWTTADEYRAHRALIEANAGPVLEAPSERFETPTLADAASSPWPVGRYLVEPDATAEKWCWSVRTKTAGELGTGDFDSFAEAFASAWGHAIKHFNVELPDWYLRRRALAAIVLPDVPAVRAKALLWSNDDCDQVERWQQDTTLERPAILDA